MGLVQTALLLLACALTGEHMPTCMQTAPTAANAPAAPTLTGAAIDVRLTAEAALVWDVTTNTILYEKNPDTRRPVASLSKLVSVLTIRDILPLSQMVEIPPQAQAAQRAGADVSLPVGHHATVADLLAASLIPSANDAIVSLAVAAAGSEEAFITKADAYAAEHGLHNTKLANASGLSGGEQYSTARDMMTALQLIYRDKEVAPYLAAEGGVLRTQEGAVRSYKTTNELLGTYLPILAAKTGYTTEAGQNLAVITQDKAGHTIGAVILGSDQRFQDMKVLVEWVWRNYTWVN